MDTNAVFDKLFADFPQARESKSLNNRYPKDDLKWRRRSKRQYYSVGPRGGTLFLSYNERSNKITIKYGKLNLLSGRSA